MSDMSGMTEEDYADDENEDKIAEIALQKLFEFILGELVAEDGCVNQGSVGNVLEKVIIDAIKMLRDLDIYFK
jgi:hypothetical protein